MPITITLTVTKGKLMSKQFNYDQHETLILGRNDDCAVVLPETTVSRYHCLMEIAPPSIMIRDFGSLNGTYLNGKKIGQRPAGMSCEEAQKQRTNEFAVKSGDRLGFGADCEITVKISIPQYCSECLVEISSAALKNSKGQPICNICHDAKKKGADRKLKCGACGVVLDDREKQIGICKDCCSNPEKALKHLLNRAANGDEALKDIAKFQMGDTIGRGGMGEVWRVIDSEGRQFALKVMLPQAATSEASRKQFIREAQLMIQLNHKNVVRAYNFGVINNIYYILMELCTGGSVDHFIGRYGGKLSIELASYIILQTLDGLIYTHGADIIATDKDNKSVRVNGVVHRDLKPGNIFITGDTKKPTVKVADFGLAKAFEIAGYSGHTFTGAVAGTPVFMPRQQIIDYRYSNPAVDVWAAAASYYFMLTGYFPKNFSGQDVFLDALNSSAVPIRQRDSNIPKRLADVIDQALVEKPKIGIQTAAELKNKILEALK